VAALAEELGLGPDQFAFYFQSDVGVEARDLGTFLQRAGTIAGRQGAVLHVTGIRPGSVAVVIRTLKKTAKKTAKAAGNEWEKAPIATTAAGSGMVAAVVGAIIYAMQPSSGPTPIAKAAADVVERHNVQRIELVTIEQKVVVMDHVRARRVREMERNQATGVELSMLPPPREEIRQLVDAGRRGVLTGNVVAIHGALYFCPDGHSFYVPIQTSLMDPTEEIYAEAHFRVRGTLVMVRGQPDHIIVYSAELV
jgi:hypothetical protein